MSSPTDSTDRQNSATEAMGAATCDCGGTVRALYAREGIETTVSNLAPIVTTVYEPLNMRCPHGVLWHAEPTTDQIVQWARDGVA